MSFYLFVLYIHELPNQLHELLLVRPQEISARARCGGENHHQVVYLRRHLNLKKKNRKHTEN